MGELGQKGGVAVAVLVGELRLRRDDLYDAEASEPVPVPGITENETVGEPLSPSGPPLDP